MNYKCELKTLPKQPTVFVRTRTSREKLPQVVGQTYGALMQYLGKQGAHPTGPPYIAYFNMDMADLDMEIGFPVSKPLPTSGEFQSGEMASGKVAACLHVGPYTELRSAYEALIAWTREQGYKTTGVSYEIYLNDPAETTPEGLQTQIIFPLKAA